LKLWYTCRGRCKTLELGKFQNEGCRLIIDWTIRRGHHDLHGTRVQASPRSISEVVRLLGCLHSERYAANGIGSLSYPSLIRLVCNTLVFVWSKCGICHSITFEYLHRQSQFDPCRTRSRLIAIRIKVLSIKSPLRNALA